MVEAAAKAAVSVFTDGDGDGDRGEDAESVETVAAGVEQAG